MVTTNSGSATPTSAPRLNCGVVNTGVASCQTMASVYSWPCSAATAMPASSTPGTA